jgi:hypothetical protein
VLNFYPTRGSVVECAKLFQSKELDGCCGSSTRLKKLGTAGIGGTQRPCRAKPSAPGSTLSGSTSFSTRLEVVEFAKRAVQKEIYCYFFFGSEKITQPRELNDVLSGQGGAHQGWLW